MTAYEQQVGSTNLTARTSRINHLLDEAPRVGLGFWGGVTLLLTYFFANYDIGVLAITLPSISTSLGLQVTDLSWPVTMNLVGYAVGAYILGHIADRRGRLWGLRGTVVVLAAGGFLTALSWDLWLFTFFRFLCGCGMGAVLALASAYIGEIAPKNKRGRYLTVLYLFQAMLITAVGFGSLPILQLGDLGWRILVGFGGVVIVCLLGYTDRVVPESPRWLAANGHIERAERITERVAARAYRDAALPTPPADVLAEDQVGESSSPLRELLKRPLLGRVILITSFWFFFYIGFYAFSSYQPIILQGLGVEASEAIWLTVLGRVSGIVSCLLLLGLIEKFERKTIIIIAASMGLVSYLLLISGFGSGAFVVANLLFTFSIGIMVPPAFTYTAEIFPTRARGTAAAIGDGVGHLGGALAPFLVLPILASFGAVPAMFAIIGTLVIAIVSIAVGPRTKDRSVVDLSE